MGFHLENGFPAASRLNLRDNWNNVCRLQQNVGMFSVTTILTKKGRSHEEGLIMYCMPDFKMLLKVVIAFISQWKKCMSNAISPVAIYC